MPQQPKPNWQPISARPMIATIIDGMLEAAEHLLGSLQKARAKPHMLDDATVGRVITAYTKQSEDFWFFQEQLARWEKTSLGATQRQEVERLKEQLERLRGRVTSILALADELKKGTIESVLSKSDVEVALDVLSGKLKL